MHPTTITVSSLQMQETLRTETLYSVAPTLCSGNVDRTHRLI